MFRNSGFSADGRRKGGRKPKKERSVIQLRVRMAGKVASFYSITVDLPPIYVMKTLQETFEPYRTR